MQAGQIIHNDEGVRLLNAVLKMGFLHNIPTHVIEWVIKPLCSIYNIPLDQVRLQLTPTTEMTLLGLADNRGQPNMLKRLKGEKNPLLLMTNLPLGTAVLSPLSQMLVPLATVTTPQSRVADEKDPRP